MDTRPRVLLVFPLPDADVEAEFARHVDIVRPRALSEDALIEAAADVDAIVTRGVGATISPSVIHAAPRLQLICAVGAGTDNIDAAAARARGVPIVSGAGVAPRPVTEYVLAAMVIGHRLLMDLHREVASGDVDWIGRVERFKGAELTETTLGIVGLGNIGREVAHRAIAAFDVSVAAYDPFVTDPGISGVELVDDLGDLLDRSLTVTVHSPLLDATRGLLGINELRRIGPDGVLVDAARGGIVDEDALVAVLRTGELKAAVIDVFAGEPPSPARLRELATVPHLTMTPHVAGVTGRSLSALSKGAVDAVLEFFSGGGVRRAVPVLPQASGLQ